VNNTLVQKSGLFYYVCINFCSSDGFKDQSIGMI